jgi:hypothetical protein
MVSAASDIDEAIATYVMAGKTGLYSSNPADCKRLKATMQTCGVNLKLTLWSDGVFWAEVEGSPETLRVESESEERAVCRLALQMAFAGRVFM